MIEPLFGIAGVLLIWEIASRIAANSTLVPPPAKVSTAFVAMWAGDLSQDIDASLLHLVVGYAAGAGAGLALALIAGSSRWCAAVIDPYAEFLRPISADRMDPARDPAASASDARCRCS